ncbi:hypothetical protein [Streptomyces erythrochromogenes]|uniref:hypothetical protein n=1 Tax=Streptomyces erythrochromogenes TaxID=285574 RepID=UPI0036904FDA
MVLRPVVIDGVRMMALTEEEFESLAASRRQFGSQVVRLRMAREALISLTDAAEAMCSLLRAGEVPVGAAAHASAGTGGQSRTGLLGALEGAVEQARRVAGGRPGKPAPPGGRRSGR